MYEKNFMEKSLDSKLKKLNVAIVSHIFASGPALDLEVFLQNRTNSLFFIGNPFSFAKDKSSFYRKYLKGKLIKEHKAFPLNLPGTLLYIKELIYVLSWIIKYDKKIDLYIGSDGYSAFLGLLLKKTGKVKDVVLYTIDYVPNRFKNPILNYLYHFF